MDTAIKPASKLQIGDVIMWDYGYTSTVTAINACTKTQIVARLEYYSSTPVSSGTTVSTWTFSKTDLVTVKGL
jgi:hypothetical protein